MYGHDRTPFKKLLVAMVWGASEAMQGKLLVLLVVGNSLSSGVASFRITELLSKTLWDCTASNLRQEAHIALQVVQLHGLKA